MAILYITSQSEKAGKTMLCAGLAQWWQSAGRKVGYHKLTGDPQGKANHVAVDNALLRNILGTPAPDENGETPGLRFDLEQTAREFDVLLVEAALPFFHRNNNLPPGKIVVIHDFISRLDPNLGKYKPLADRLIGVVINKVPRRKLAFENIKLTTRLSHNAMELLGVIPEDRTLNTLSVADLAEAVKGKILNNEEKSSVLIENLMLGNSTFDRGAAYYNRKNNKAVLLWGERAGFRKAVVSNYQLAALQTSTRCIVISHSAEPLPAVMQKAQELGIPIISAPGTLPEVAERLEGRMPELGFHQELKLPRLREVLTESVRINRIEAALA